MGKSVRVVVDWEDIVYLQKVYGDVICTGGINIEIKPTPSQLIKIALGHLQGKEVHVISKKKKLIVVVE